MMSSIFQTALESDLISLVGAGGISRDATQLERVARDWWSMALWWSDDERCRHRPSAVVAPSNIEELSRVLYWANKKGIAAIPRGGGSGVCGSAIALRDDAIVLETTRLNKVVHLEADSQHPRVIVEAGILGGDLERQLNSQGYSLRHFPASLEISSVGGWVACGSYGQLSTLYGGIGEQAEQVQAVLPDGSLIKTTVDDFLYSEGSFGVITQATLKIRPNPKQQYFLSCEFEAIQDGLDFVRRLIERDLKPTVARLYDPLEAKSAGLAYSKDPILSEDLRFQLRVFLLKHLGIVRFLQKLRFGIKRWLLVMIFDEHQVNEHREVEQSIRQQKIPTKEKPAQVWLAKRSQWNTDKVTKMLNDGCFVDTLDTWATWSQLPRLYEEVMRRVSPHALAMGHVSHYTAQGGCLYLILAGKGRSRQDSINRYQSAWRLAMEACVAVGAKVNHHHGVGLAKLPWKEYTYSKEIWNRLAQTKAKFDPQGIMNPGKIL